MPDLEFSAPDIPKIIQLSYGMEQANTYLLIKDSHAIVVDVCSTDVVEELRARNLLPDFVILTHEHADHLWGLNALREQFPAVKVIAQEYCSEAIMNSKTNKAAEYRIYAILRFREEYRNTEAMNRKYCCAPAEITFSGNHYFRWSGHDLRLIHTPGHSPGSCIILVEENIAFTGDTVLKEDTFLQFDGGDESKFETVTLPIINSIKPDVRIFPGHGKPFLKRDWKK